MIRANSRLRHVLGPSGVAFIEHATGAIQRILPHVEVSSWSEGPWEESKSVWTSSALSKIRMTLAIGEEGAHDARSLTAFIERKRLPVVGGMAARSFDLREHDICKRISSRISEVLQRATLQSHAPSLEAIAAAFDEHVVAFHVAEHHALQLSVSEVFSALHTLSEQSYENKSLTFGCILDPTKIGGSRTAQFPRDFLASKKYKALTDGFRTAYHISRDGKILGFVDLED
ncbi:MAG TPA: hypothetical protein VJN67_18595, partial [Stellaceae bacterium]|nr:hypothetical protein [Stellaceae bacterium]